MVINMMFKMSFIILAILLIVAAIATTVAIAKKQNKSFENEKRRGVAVIVGHADDSTASNVRFMVKVLDSGDESSYNLKGVYNMKTLGGKLDTKYPHFETGDEVKVYYAPKKIMGIKLLEVEIDRDAYDYPN